MKPLVTAIGICVFLLAGSTANADVHIWTNSIADDNDWSTGGNWFNGQDPDTGDEIRILYDARGECLSIYDGDMVASVFGALRIGNNTCPMTLQVDNSDIYFDSCSVVGSWTHSDDTVNDYSIIITDDNGGTGQMSLDETTAHVTINTSLTTFAEHLEINADDADDGRTFIKEGGGTLDITNAVTMTAGTHEAKSTVPDNAIFDVDAGTVIADDLNLYGGQGADYLGYGTNGWVLMDMASSTTLTVSEDMYVTGDAQFETDENVSMDGLYVGASSDEACLYTSGSGTISVHRLIIEGSSSGNSYCIIGAGNLDVD